MENTQKFVDYYEVLKVSPDCDSRILELAYHYFAKMFHPDNPATADSDKFTQVIEAYRALNNPDKRAGYDRIYARNPKKPTHSFAVDSELDEKTAADDGDAHTRILLALYKRRREHAGDAGVIGWYLQEMLGCTEDHFAFHVWYLKSKGFIEVTEQGTIAVTVQGADHVLATSRANRTETLLIQQFNNPGN